MSAPAGRRPFERGLAELAAGRRTLFKAGATGLVFSAATGAASAAERRPHHHSHPDRRAYVVVIDGCRPFLAPHFNLTVELPLKAIVRGFSFVITPISWQNRKYGEAKLKIKEMGSRYFFICAYVWLEKYFSRGDYRRQ